MFLRDLTQIIGERPSSLASAAAITPDQTIHNAPAETHNLPHDSYHDSQVIPPTTQPDNTYTSPSLPSNVAISTVTGRALYEFVAENPSELSLIEGQLVTNIRWVDADWSEGTSNGQTGMFPALFVEALDDPSVHSSAQVESSPLATGVLVLYDFTAMTHDELSVTEGQCVTVIGQSVDDWMRVRDEATGREGLCPTSFLGLSDVSQPEVINEVVMRNGHLTNNRGVLIMHVYLYRNLFWLIQNVMASLVEFVILRSLYYFEDFY